MNTVVIFSGYNQRAVIAFLRTLTENNIDNYYIVAANENDTILRTAYKNKVFTIRKNKALEKKELLEIVNSILIKSGAEHALIAPSTEALNRFLLENREELTSKGWIIPLVSSDVYQLISDKESFWKYCKNQSLLVPRLVDLSSAFLTPYVAKPLCYQSSEGQIYTPILVHNEQEHKYFLEHYNQSDLSFQEYITGNSYYLLYYFSVCGEVYQFSQENLAQQFGGKSIIAARRSTLHLTSISDKYVESIRKLNYHGFLMIELRERDGFFYMIEANPRFWGPSQFYHDCGIEFFELFLKDYDIIDSVSIDEKTNEIFYFWSGGCKGDILDGNKCVFYNDGFDFITKNIQTFKKWDIYHREDTVEIYNLEKKGF